MLPVLGGGGITRDYGVRSSAYALGWHTGRDYRARIPRPAYATRGGRVVFAGRYGGWGSAYGRHVIVDTNGVRHLYAHLSIISVRAGQTVRTGQRLGYTGATGNVSGPHLHYEERYAPYRYGRDVRNPRFDRMPQKVLDVSVLAECARYEPGRVGCKHIAPAQVLELRRLLRRRGYKVRLSGHYSRGLKDVYKRWERRLGFAPTGIPGPRGLAALVEGSDARVRD